MRTQLTVSRPHLFSFPENGESQTMGSYLIWRN